jgi:hypothetical protein
VGIERRQPPILSGRVEFVGRRADGKIAEYRRLVTPRIGAIRIDADGEIEIKPDRQTEFFRLVTAGGELIVGDPLQKLEEPAFTILPSAKFIQRCRVGVLPGIGPLPLGGTIETPPQDFEAGEAGEFLPLRGAKVREPGCAFCRPALKKPGIDRAQHPLFQRRDADIVYKIVRPQRLNRFAERRVLDALEFGYRRNVNVERIEKQPTVRRIRTGGFRPVQKQGMQGVQSNRTCTATRREPEYMPKIREVADPPIRRRANRIELHRKAPARSAITLERAQVDIHRRTHIRRRGATCRKPIDEPV